LFHKSLFINSGKPFDGVFCVDIIRFEFPVSSGQCGVLETTIDTTLAAAAFQTSQNEIIESISQNSYDENTKVETDVNGVMSTIKSLSKFVAGEQPGTQRSSLVSGGRLQELGVTEHE
jgi:hypothetical protein